MKEPDKLDKPNKRDKLDKRNKLNLGAILKKQLTG